MDQRIIVEPRELALKIGRVFAKACGARRDARARSRARRWRFRLLRLSAGDTHDLKIETPLGKPNCLDVPILVVVGGTVFNV